MSMVASLINILVENFSPRIYTIFFASIYVERRRISLRYVFVRFFFRVPQFSHANNAYLSNNSIVRLCGIVTCTAPWLTRNFTLQNNTAHNERNDTDRTRLREVPRIHNRGNCFTYCIFYNVVAFNLTI